MKINRLRFKNFASYGNKIQEIKFSENNGNFYLVVGANGNGKSTILHVISWLIYGKVINKKITDIPNRFNGDVWGEIELQKDFHTKIIIERTQKSIELTTIVNNERIIYDQAGKRNVQNYIEEELVRMPFYVFNNVIGLSINDFKSFLTMSPKDKRQIIDKICNLDIINRIRDFVKTEMRDVKDQLIGIENQISVLETTIKSSKQELESLKRKITTNTTDKIAKLKEDINKYRDYITNLDNKIKKLDNNKDKIVSIKNNLIAKINDTQNFFKDYKKKQLLYSNDQCPTCESSLKTEEHQHIFNTWEEQYKERKSYFDTYKENLEKVKQKEKSVIEIEKKLNKNIYTANIYLKNAINEIAKLENIPATEETQSLQNIINNTIEDIQNAKVKKKKTDKKSNFYKILEDIFGDHGVKKLAIKKILPTLNIEINKGIKDLSLEYRVQFNEEFDSSIWHLGYEVSANMLSTGERKKIDFAILIAMIKLIKTKYQGLNIFFLDEIFSSIDSNSIHNVIQILNKISKDMKLNIFVINHAPLPLENFDYIINTEKNNNFSNITMEKIIGV